ncbi:hypothetical protein A1O1_08820 [Capronia coronata CBS 617.96]|uniref:Uncharacterized protein n=1 Tax=Capronia coronata CBS 617.96 TaxID=1182541 RepID=W9XM80_9EURO|nr:uncharacterized protein A1O1_08820 [Capronia coronata CBS 617.96]EXJ78420.1 hypothetical protein A1O1_08820 [Capronia coronata CBS 617.96]
MPNVSFDIFFDKDFINVTATRGYKAPKAKPEWKVRTLPKLAPKPQPEDPSTPRPLPRDKLVHSRQPPAHQKQLEPAPASEKGENKVEEISSASSQSGDKPKRKPPKLGPKKSTTTPSA